MNAQSHSARSTLKRGEGVLFWVGVTIALAGIVAKQLDVIADRSRD